MDEKKMAEEFANIYKAIGSNRMDLSDTSRNLLMLVRHYNHHIEIFNQNVDMMNQNLRMLQKYAKRQNIAILAGIGGFLYLCKKIQKLEDATKKE